MRVVAAAVGVWLGVAGCATAEPMPFSESEVVTQDLPRFRPEAGPAPEPTATDGVAEHGAARPPEPSRERLVPLAEAAIPGIRTLENVHPALRTRALILFERARAEGIAVTFIFGYTPYTPRKRTGPGGWATWHQFGLAFDLNLSDRRDLDDGRKHFAADAARWQRIGAIATELGLAWGGAWRSSYDPFHFEWHPGNDSVINREDLRRFLSRAGPRGERFREVWPLYPEPNPPGPSPAPDGGDSGSPSPPESEPAAHAPPSDRFTIALGGDVAFPRGKNDAALDAVGPHAFEALQSRLSEATLRFANLEAPLTDRPPIAKKPFPLTQPPERFAWLVRAGFNLLSLANNHIADAGAPGIADTLAVLTRAHQAQALWFAGADPNPANLAKTLVFRVPGTRLDVAFLAFGNGYAREVAHWAGPAEAAALARIRAARKAAAFVIVSVHGGREYEHAPDRDLARVLRAMVDAGADLVVSHHAHVVRGIERRGRAAIFYGLGNLAFGSITERHHATGATLLGMLPLVDVVAGRITQVRVVPLWVDNGEPFAPPGLAPLAPTPFAPQPLHGGYARAALAAIDGFSALVPGNATRFEPLADGADEGRITFAP